MGARGLSAAYIDVSALVKLFKAEPETDALLEEVERWDAHLSSELVLVEAMCTARRLGPQVVDRAARAVGALDLIPFSESVRNAAAASRYEPALRALDAIHLASALSLGSDVGAFLAYDRDLCAAAAARGLRVITPHSLK